jgi:hypothetical protein
MQDLEEWLLETNPTEVGQWFEGRLTALQQRPGDQNALISEFLEEEAISRWCAS